MLVRKAVGEGSLTAQAYELLREDIITCQLKPDERLRVEELRVRYGVGSGSLREALMRLEAEGLVLLEPNKGFRVLPISREHLLDVMRARAELDALCLKWSMQEGGVEWESALVGALHRLKRLSKKGSSSQASHDDWHTAHHAFHSTLITGCKSEILKSFHSALSDHVDRYVAISVSIDEIPRDDNSEHEEIVCAVLDHDCDTAVQLLRTHLMKTSDKLVATLFSEQSVTAE